MSGRSSVALGWACTLSSSRALRGKSLVISMGFESREGLGSEERGSYRETLVALRLGWTGEQ